MPVAYSQRCPPTGKEAWCQAVEAHAASVFLREGEFWDDVEAPGYRLITSLQSAPAELRNLAQHCSTASGNGWNQSLVSSETTYTSMPTSRAM